MVDQLPSGVKANPGAPSSNTITMLPGIGANSYTPSYTSTGAYNFDYAKVKADAIDSLADVAAQFALKNSPNPQGTTHAVLKSATLNMREFQSDMTLLFDSVDYAMRNWNSMTSSNSYSAVKAELEFYVDGWLNAAAGALGGSSQAAQAVNISLFNTTTLPTGVIYSYKTAYAIYDVGWSANGYVYSSAKNDVVLINNAPGRVSVGAGNDIVIFNIDNASAVDEAGWDVYVFAEGRNSLSFSGNRQSYSIAASDDGLAVTNTLTGERDMVFGADRLQFANGTLVFDADGTAGQAYRLYQAAFDRKPDTGGVSYWVNQLDKGAISISDMARAMIGSPEFQSKYGAVSDARFVSLVYQNVLHRAQDAGGAAYWQGELSRGMSREALLLNFSESNENVSAVAADVNAGIFLV